MSIYIKTGDISYMQGPCPAGFHVPSKEEWEGVANIMVSWNRNDIYYWQTYLHLPQPGEYVYSFNSRDFHYRGDYGIYLTSTAYDDGHVYVLWSKSYNYGSTEVSTLQKNNAYSIRAFKNELVLPDSNWTVIYGTLGSAGVFWNQTDGIITITADGTTGYTLADKNMGATQVWTSGLPGQETGGSLYQWGNNYGFPVPPGESITQSTTRVDTTGYGPGNFYNSSTYILTGEQDWSNPSNNNLWGGETGPVSMKEVQNIYIGEVRGKYTPTANTIAYYPLTKDVLDYSGNGNDGSGNPDSFTGEVANYSGNSTILPTSLVSSGTRTMNVWFSDSGVWGYYKNIGMLSQHTETDYGFVIRTNSYYNSVYITGIMQGPTGTNPQTYSMVKTTSSPLTGWHNMVCIRDTSNLKLKLYLDGVYVGEASYSGLSNNTLYMGYDHGFDGGAWTGKISELIFEDKVRTAEEVSNYYNKTRTYYGV